MSEGLKARATELVALLKQGAQISRDRSLNLDYAKVAEEAANEIERLTAAVEEQRRIIETLNAGIGCATTLESIRVLDERDAKLAALKQESIDNAKMMLLLTEDLQYIAGIVEKGRGQPTIEDNLTVRSAILGYVQELEAKLAAIEKADRHVRRLLCVAVATMPYMDDGEASDQEIDYLREPPADIERKLQERGRKQLAAARAAPVPEGRRVTTTRIANHLKKSPLGDISMYRDGFFDGAKWAAKEAP